MNAFTLKAPAHPVFQIQPERSHPRLSLTRVLWTKFLRWIDKATPQAMIKLLVKLLATLLIATVVFAPHFLLGLLTASASWNGYRIPIFLAALAVTLNAKRLWRWATRVRARGGNQHTFKGIPVDELATFLIERGAFKRDEAMSHFAITQDKHAAIAEALESNHVLTRGENNARVLNAITREQLVRQLRDDFPLGFHQGEWVEKKGSFHLFLRDEERRDQKKKEQIDRLARREERLRKNIEELTESPFLRRELVA